MNENVDIPQKSSFKWRHPSEAIQLQKLKRKKKALAARINLNQSININNSAVQQETSALFDSIKRKNPFLKANTTKKTKTLDLEDCSQDNTLFKLLSLSSNHSEAETAKEHQSFTNILGNCEEPIEVKSQGEKWVPLDWSLKRKVRFLSQKPLNWNSKLKISEEASGITSFTRCLDADTTTTLDTSSNSKFHQCCLYWQHPSIPWLSLFPRSNAKNSQSIPLSAQIKESMHTAWADSMRSLFHLIRTRQCPYFYVCANSFSVVFRAAGIGGFNEINAMVSPTTRGFRQMLKQEEIEFAMPLKESLQVASSHEMQENAREIEEEADEKWLHSMGVNSEDIKQINYAQDKITRKIESEVDNSEQSLILIQGVEVQAFYSFLINCKSAVAATGVLAGVPPTLLAPVAYHGATLMSLTVRESKVHLDHEDFYSLDLTGPLLPQTIHNLCLLHQKENSMTATFSTLPHTESFSKVTAKNASGAAEDKKTSVDIFNLENLSDCGLKPEILKHFCSNEEKVVSNIECLKYSSETGLYLWT